MPDRQPRDVTYICEWCSRERTELRPPGPLPRYCPECKQAAQASLAAGRMRHMRERRRDPLLRPRRGRPPKG